MPGGPSAHPPSLATMPAIAKVEPLVTARALRGPFDYALPEEMADVEVGTVLRVPFGRRRLLGVVVELAETSELPPERLASPIEALEAGVPAELVRLGLWVARQWCSTPSRGLGLVLPPGTGAGGQRTRSQSDVVAELTEPGREAATGDGAAPDGGRKLGIRQLATLRALADGPRTAADLRASAGAQRATLRGLAERGLLGLETIERRRAPELESAGAPPRVVELNEAQRAALEAITAALDDPAELLLHGVTGSGKTEVYLAAAEEALARERGVIVLVPEIALTPQTVGRFRHRLGETVAVMHSGLSVGARYDEWRRLRSGEARVCVGPRSAVFAPVRDLGLLVIDEEHDSSYKQESDPRYDARTVARRRAGEAGAVLLCGTATPRPESWGELRKLELPERVDGLGMPPVELVDMRGPVSGPLHPRTIEALGEVARAGGKAIVMINRRGWSPYVACRSCGQALECPNCDVSLVLHQYSRPLLGQAPASAAGPELRCHHCSHTQSMPEACSECGSVTLARVGTGTEHVAEELGKLLSPLPVMRLDADAAVGTGAHAAILGRFQAAESAVLVGTQMVAKGHDFPEVTLAVVLDADATLHFPDFRAEERTFALITQLAGRSGRGERGGRVLVQTRSPEAPSIRHAASHDAAGFLGEELGRREALRYPPFSHLVEVGFSSPDPAPLDRAAEGLREAIAPQLPNGAELLGPAPQFRLRGRERRRLLIKAPLEARTATVDAIRDAVEAAASERRLADVALSVDVDPQ
jgi:primosomal protein N' (replication factor Y)